jgi:hypothetical protein
VGSRAAKANKLPVQQVHAANLKTVATQVYTGTSPYSMLPLSSQVTPTQSSAHGSVNSTHFLAGSTFHS